MKLSPNEMAWCLVQAGFTGSTVVDSTTYSDVAVGVAIGWAESGGDTDALGKVTTGTPPSGNFDHGWLQISNKWHWQKMLAATDWRHPVVNAQLARLVFNETAGINARQSNGKPGWSAWSVWSSGSFKTWLPHGQLAALHPFPPTLSEYRPVINVAAPDVIVNPTPVTIDPREIPLVVTVSPQPAAPHVYAGGLVFASSP